MSIREVIYIVFFLILFGLIGSCNYYKSQYADEKQKSAHLQKQIEQAQSLAESKLQVLTAERDQKQAEIDRLAKAQEKKDATAKIEIARLSDELRNRPVRVRIVTEAAGSSHSTTGKAGTGTKSGTTDTSPAYGVLPEENSRRLADALTEVEMLSAAYNSCRATILPVITTDDK